MVRSALFTERELDVMSILWREGSGTVAEVRDELPVALGYTGVLKVLQILESKGMVRHEQEGRAYRYRPVTAAQVAGREAMSRILEKMFLGSPEAALEGLLDGRTLDPAQAERMKDLLEAAARSPFSRANPPAIRESLEPRPEPPPES